MTEANTSQHRFGGPWTEIKLGVLKQYLAAYSTVWYLFPISGIYRQAARSLEAVDQHKTAALDRCLATSGWRDAFYQQNPQLDLFGTAPGMERFVGVDAIESYVRDRLQEVFPAVARPLRLPRTGPPFYSLFFAVSSPSPKAQALALRLAKAILDKAQ